MISGYTQHEDGKLEFAGRVGTGFSERLLKALSDGLARIAVKACLFFNLPAAGRGHLDPGLSGAEMRRATGLGRSSSAK